MDAVLQSCLRVQFTMTKCEDRGLRQLGALAAALPPIGTFQAEHISEFI
jgi:hypothetical protein